MRIKKLKKCRDCEWMFVTNDDNSAWCNDCGNSTTQPRVCKAGGNETDFETILKLAEYAITSYSGVVKFDDILSDVVRNGLRRAVEKERDSKARQGT